MVSYVQVLGGPSRLSKQGRDALLKGQFIHVSKGLIGWIHPKHIISALRGEARQGAPEDGHGRMGRGRRGGNKTGASWRG